MKEIFIGSSSEAIKEAKEIAALLDKVDGVKPILWTEAFSAGDITFLAIEEIASRVSGALFVVSPDDKSFIRGEEVMIPRANVIFEYGYLVAKLTRYRVALCCYSGAELPSDFNGLTYIPMGDFEKSKSLGHDTRFKIESWASELQSLKSGLGATTLVHGYSGIWNSESIFSKWRRGELQEPDYVVYHATVILNIPTDGMDGKGCIYGTLRAQVGECYAEFQRSDQIKRARVNKDGSLSIRGLVQSRQLIRIEGEPPQKDGFEDHLRGTREFNWELQAVDGDGDSWTGRYETSVAGALVSDANLKFYR